MPDIRELGRKVKAKFPGVYDDLDDGDLGRRVKAKYPGAYDDFTDAPAQPAAEEPGFFSRQISNIGTGLQRIGADVGNTALAIADFVRGAQTGDVRPAAEIGERAIRTVASLIGEGAGGGEIGEAVRDPAALAAAQQRSETRQLTESPFKEGFQGVRELQRRADVRAARDPSLTGKIVRRGTEFIGKAAPAVFTGIATGGSLPTLATLATLQSAGQPETLPLNVALEAGSLPVAQAFRAGINTVRRQLGKGAAQIIEAEATPAAIAQVRREIGEIAPPVVPETPRIQAETAIPATQTGAAIPTPTPLPTVDALPTVFAKLGTDNIDQIGAMIANANRRFKKKNFTPEQRASAIADYNALNQLTPDERRALGEVLPMRNTAPVRPDFAGTGPTARDIQNIPMSEFELDPQLAANLRHAMSFFDEQGRLLQAAEDAAILGDIGPAATSGSFAAPPARVSAADLITAPPPPRAAPPQPAPSVIADRIRTMARTPTSPVSVAEVRRQFPGVSKKEFDDEMVRLVEDGQIALHRHDAPGQLTAAERDAMVKIGDNYFTAATVREAPSVRAAAAGVAGPRVGADLEMRAAAGGARQPPAPPFFSPDDPWGPWGLTPEERALFPTPPVEGVPAGFGGQAPRGQQQLFDASARSPWQDTALAYFRANLLTNPVGRALDIGSTIVNQFADAAVRPIAAAVDVVISKLTGQRSITGPSLRGTGRAFGSVRQGLRDVREVLRTGQQPIDSGADDVLYGREIRSGLGRGFDVPVNGMFRLLGALDAPFRRFAFARNLQDRARVAAINEAKRGRIPREQTVVRARELIDRDDIIAAAVRDGERAVLSEPNKISNWVAAQTRNSPTAQLAFGLIQPFVRIPLNAVFKAADFAGVGGVKALYKIARGGVRKTKGQSFFRDLEDQRVFAQNVAAGSFAPAAFILGMELEEQGKLEGYFFTGRRDFPGRRSPTSIDIGGTRYDIQRLGGFIFAPLFIGATYNRLRKEDVGKANALLRSFSGLVQQAPALGYHGAPAKVGRILASNEPGGEILKEAGGIASGAIPARGFLGATAKALDPVKRRQAEGFTGPIMSSVPGLRQQLPATGNDAIDAAVERNSPLLVELQRLGIRVAELQRKKDEPDDKFNSRVQQFGQNYTSYGLRLIQHPRFQIASDDVKTRALKRLNEKAKGLTHKEFAFPEIELDPGLILDSVEK